jgi:hypothetical protein
MSRHQASKRSRRHRKQARHAALDRNVAHPSHMAGRRWRFRPGHSGRTLADVLAEQSQEAL